MHRILEAVGVKPTVLNLIPDIVDSCRTCRMFQRPPFSSAATSRLTTSFNGVVQHDLLFIESHFTCWQDGSVARLTHVLASSTLSQ
eukprot:2080723-Prorocentrum_lima.AAC.1